MAILTISSPSQYMREIVARQLAEKTGYDTCSREILLEASEHYNVPEIKLARAMNESPNIFERFTHGKEKYVAFFRAELLNHLTQGNIIYHGILGQLFVQGIPHVLKVRVVPSMAMRVADEMERENVSEKVARKRIEQADKERANWVSALYKMDTTDSDLYDLVINLEHISVEQCVDIILSTLNAPYFQKNEVAVKHLKDLAIIASVKAAIACNYLDATVSCTDGNVKIKLDPPVSRAENRKREILSLIKDVEGIESVKLDIRAQVISGTPMHK